MNQHTPGPWYMTGSSPEGSVYSATHELIVPWSPLQSDRKMANARLIASAPEMLEWMREVLTNDVPGYKTRMERGRALLARIDGT